MPVISRRTALILPAAALAAPAYAQQNFPSRPIRMIVPWGAGGTTDVQMRALCEAASRRLGQPIIVDNRAGAGGVLGAQALLSAAPDGYTLSQMPNGVFRMPAMMRAQNMTPPFDPMQDFTWVIRLVGYMGGVVVRPDAPWRTMRQLLDHARANPGTLFYGTPGANTTDVTMTRLARMLGIEWTAVPFRGAAPNLQNLLAGLVALLLGAVVYRFRRTG